MKHLIITPLLLLLAGGASAQSDIDTQRRSAIVTAIERVSPAVVTINVVNIQRTAVLDPRFDEYLRMFGFAPFGGMREVEREVQGIGSGFIFDTSGHILTNYHVLQGADAIASVTLPDGRNLDVEFVGADERTDLAVLRAKGENLPNMRFGNSENLLTGEWVIAIGNPFGNMIEDPQPSVSVGVVSANHRRVSREVGGGERLYQDLIQTDAAINPGNSGGPLVNASGEVVGVNTMIFSNTGGYQGLGFAIPINRARRVAEEIIEFGRRRNPWLGFRGEALEELRPQTLQEMGIRAGKGVLITEILKTSPAYAAGLQLGDVVLELNSEQVDDPLDVDFLNWGMFVGDSVELLVERHGKRSKVAFVIEEL